MPHAIGRKLTLSHAHRYFYDLLLRARRNTTATVHRRMRLAAVAAARESAMPRPSWDAVFLKAFAHVSAENPLLRRCYLTWPWPRLYEHAETIAAVSIDRSHKRENELALVLLHRPQSCRLSELDAALQGEDRISHLPRTGTIPLRIGLACSGRFRAACCGTFSVVAQQPIAHFAPALHHGLADERGEVNVCLTYDNRVLDSYDAARALGEVEMVLQERILYELRYIESLEAA